MLNFVMSVLAEAIFFSVTYNSIKEKAKRKKNEKRCEETC